MYPYGQPEYLRLVRVKNVGQISQVSVQPMERVLAVCEDDPVFAFVSANGFGQPNTQYYRMDPFEPQSTNDNVSRSEFAAMQAQLNQLVQMLTQKKEEPNESAS